MKINEKGQVLIIVTLSFVVLALFAGLAVDIGTGYLLRARLFRVVDAAALAAAKALKGQEAFKDQAKKAACDAARMNGLSCGEKDADILVSFVEKPVEGGPDMLFVQIKGNASVPTTLLRLLSLIGAGDFSKLSVKASAEAGPERPVDLVLALDRSGSMKEVDETGTAKIDALKKAVNEFLNNNFSANDRIGMVSFATRGCGDPTTGTDFIGDKDCEPDMPLQDLGDGGYLTKLQDAVNTLVADGGTNTMEALRTARKPIEDAFGLPDRATSRKVVLLVTDGQPTFMKRFNNGDCKKNPRNDTALFDGDAFPNDGCLFGVPGWTNESLWSTTPGENPGMFRTLLTEPNDFACSRRIPKFKLFAEETPVCEGTGNATLYRNVIAGTRSTQNGAMFEANNIRKLGDKNVLVFAIAIGKDTHLTSPQDSLDNNAKCLLARIANAKEIENAAKDTVEQMVDVCNNVFTTTEVDGDTHLDLKENWPLPCTPGPPCIDGTQKVGRVFLVDMSVSGEDVTKQLKKIFAKVAALLKIRLTS